MKVFITGSSGFIGRELVKHLSNKKCEVVCFDSGQGKNLLDKQLLSDCMAGADVVVHLAAIPRPVPSKSFAEYFAINCQGTLNVCEAAVENNVKRLVYSSSTTYYGVEKGIPFTKPIKENNQVLTQFAKAGELTCRPSDLFYSTSKVIAEQVLANYGLTKKLDVIILRLGPTCSYGEVKPFLGINLKMENAIQALEKAINSRKTFWYEAFTIADDVVCVDLAKAEKLLGYNPT